jgi:dienelactone hydrolase/pimeloyl-ACP methyl ester carboxylesterase
MDPLNRFPRMLQEYVVGRVRDVEQQADKRRDSLKTKADALAWQADVKKKLRKIFGPLPARTPLKPEVVGRVERKYYTVEKIIFESRPDFPVTANLYLPKGYDFPQPGVLAPCGHSATGKGEPYYQAFCQGLATKGYVVLIYDPIGQGERLQYFDRKGQPVFGPGCIEHNQIGNQQLLVDEFFGSWRVWDGIRALDYLVSRPEVDPTHIGLTGNSGGGTLTTMLLANDQRFTMAAPGCFVTTTRCNAENEMPQDSEQLPPGLLAHGLDVDDMFALHAPNPLILLTQEKDYFDQRGAIQILQRFRHLYKLLGAEQNVALFTGPDTHGYRKPLREAMYSFFNQHCDKKDETSKEPRTRVEEGKVIEATASGQVRERKPRTVFSFTSETSKAFAAKRKPLKGKALQRALQELLSISAKRATPHYRILRPVSKRDYPLPHAASYAVETEPGVLTSVLMPSDEPYVSRPPRKGKRATLYVSHLSADDELRSEPFARDLVGGSIPFFAMDVRGIGDSEPGTCSPGTFFSPYGSHYFYGSYGTLFAEPLVGRCTHDVLSVIDFLADNGYTQIHLVAKGWGTFAALFAATLDDRVRKVTLKHAARSYTELAETELQNWPIGTLLPGVLKKLDLPDLHTHLGKRLEMIEPWSAVQTPK